MCVNKWFGRVCVVVLLVCGPCAVRCCFCCGGGAWRRSSFEFGAETLNTLLSQQGLGEYLEVLKAQGVGTPSDLAFLDGDQVADLCPKVNQHKPSPLEYPFNLDVTSDLSQLLVAPCVVVLCSHSFICFSFSSFFSLLPYFHIRAVGGAQTKAEGLDSHHQAPRRLAICELCAMREEPSSQMNFDEKT